MEAYNIIKAFLRVIDTQPYVFTTETINDLSAIKQTLKELENQPLQAAADAIITWCKQNPDVRDAVVSVDREISQVSAGNPVNQETTLVNHFPEWQKPIENRQNNPESKQHKK